MCGSSLIPETLGLSNNAGLRVTTSRTFQVVLREATKKVVTVQVVARTTANSSRVSHEVDRPVAATCRRDQEVDRNVVVGVVMPQSACREAERTLSVCQEVSLGATRMPRTAHADWRLVVAPESVRHVVERGDGVVGVSTDHMEPRTLRRMVRATHEVVLDTVDAFETLQRDDREAVTEAEKAATSHVVARTADAGVHITHEVDREGATRKRAVHDVVRVPSTVPRVAQVDAREVAEGVWTTHEVTRSETDGVRTTHEVARGIGVAPRVNQVDALAVTEGVRTTQVDALAETDEVQTVQEVAREAATGTAVASTAHVVDRVAETAVMKAARDHVVDRTAGTADRTIHDVERVEVAPVRTPHEVDRTAC